MEANLGVYKMSSLPKLKVQKFKLTVPSTKEVIEYRPFLVGEEKVLLMALESKDVEQIIGAMRQIIDVCTFNKLNLDKMPNFDLEYIFMQIRGKSVGNIIEFNIKSEDGETEIPLKINIDDIRVLELPGHDKIIHLSEGENGIVGCELRYPVYEDIKSYIGIEDDNVLGLQIAKDCLVKIFDDNTVVDVTDPSISQEELDDWFNSLDRESLSKISNFFATMPSLKHVIKYKDGDKDKELIIEGLEGFFTLG